MKAIVNLDFHVDTNDASDMVQLASLFVLLGKQGGAAKPTPSPAQDPAPPEPAQDQSSKSAPADAPPPVVGDISGGKKTRTRKPKVDSTEAAPTAGSAAELLAKSNAAAPSPPPAVAPPGDVPSVNDVRSAVEAYCNGRNGSKAHGVKPTMAVMVRFGGTDAAKIPPEKRAGLIAALAPVMDAGE